VTNLTPRTIPTDYTPINNQIIAYIQTQLLAAIFNPNDIENQDLMLFEFGKSGNMQDITRIQTPGFALEDGGEKKEALHWPWTDKFFRVFVNFKIEKQEGVDQYAMVRYYFGRIVQVLVKPDTHLGGLVLNITETGNTPEINGQGDPEPGGTVILDIEYRHAHGDMFSQDPTDAQ